MSTKKTGNREDDERSFLDQLLEDSRLYKSSQDYLDLLQFIARMRNFAPFNALLLQIQKPGLRFAASKHDWRERFHAEVKEDARPLLILWPFGPVALVYDAVDLVSGNIPVDAQAFVAKGPITEDGIMTFIGRMKSKDIAVSITDAGDGQAGSMQMTESPKDEKTRGCYKMKINGNHTPDVRFVTIAHELAHLFLGHLGEDKKWGIKDRLRCTHTQRELEAESVAFLVAKRNGVESRSETYLANYVRDNPVMENLDFYQMTRAAGQIETLLGVAAHTQFDPPAPPKALSVIDDDLVKGMEGLFAAPLPAAYDSPIQADRRDILLPIVDRYMAAGVATPEDLAERLKTLVDGKLMRFSQSLWSFFKSAGAKGEWKQDWAAVYGGLEAPQLTEAEEQAKNALFDAFDGLVEGLKAAPVSETFNRPIPQDRFMGLMGVAHSWLQNGINTPEKLAQVMLDLAPDRKAVKFTQTLWQAIKGLEGVEGGLEPDWAAVYGAIDSQVTGAAYPEILQHPINRAASLRMEKEGMIPLQGMVPVAALAFQVLIQEGMEDTPDSFALVEAGKSAEATTELVDGILTPEQILEDDLSDLAAMIIAELREPIIWI